MRRLFDHDRLKAPFERGVGFDVFAVLVERRRADALQFAARELGLDHRAQVERRAFGRAGTDERVQLVDEEHDVARAALDFVENALDAAFELAAILRARDERAERKREHAFSAQRGAARCRRRCAARGLRRSPSCRRPARRRGTGLFLLRRARIETTRSISSSRPMTGSSFPSRASSVRSRE